MQIGGSAPKDGLAYSTVAVALTVAVACAMTPAVATADHPATGHSVEAAVLGAEHAAQHDQLRRSQVRALRRWRALPRSVRRDRRLSQENQAIRRARATTDAAGPPAVVGHWTSAPFRLPTYAIHSAVLPTGKVLFWGYPPLQPDGTRPEVGEAAIWDPSKGTGPESMRALPPPSIDADEDPSTPPLPAPLYCSGQSFLPDGRLLITGGNLVWPTHDPDDAYTDYVGLNRVFEFDPWTEQWLEQPRMEVGRWYPSQTLMADGRTVVMAGYTHEAPGATVTDLVEEFTPGADGGTGTITTLSGANRFTDLYPRNFLMRDGDLFMAGPGQFNVAKLDTSTPGSGTWTGLAGLDHPHQAGAAVLHGGGPTGSNRVTMTGGHTSVPAPDGNWYGTTSVENFDYSNPASGWSDGPSLKVPRAHHNTVLLPNGSMVAVGGGLGLTKERGNWAVDPEGKQRQVEIFDPAKGTWRLGAAQVEDRTYHSTAVLLPDGRVWSAGDDGNPALAGGAPTPFDNGEIWTPPYLYGLGGTLVPRPRVTAAPSTAQWGDELTIRAARNGPDPATAVLMAPAAVTHGVDMSQRRVPLQVTRKFDGTRIRVKAPPAPEIAPPGYYMLFVLDAAGTPSVAHWIRLGS